MLAGGFEGSLKKVMPTLKSRNDRTAMVRGRKRKKGSDGSEKWSWYNVQWEDSEDIL